MTALRIVVGGMLSMPPFSPGTAWDRMAYVAGLRQLGHQVVFVEEVRREWCRDSAGRPCDYAASTNRSVFRRTMKRFGLVSSACQIFEDGRQLTGLSRSRLHAAMSDADLLVNISGHVRTPLVLGSVARRAYVDQDPVYTQLWDAEWGADLGLDDHDVHFTTGTNIGTPRSDIPVGNRRWHHTVPPVIADSWLVPDPPPGAPYTTVASVGRYADLPHAGRWYRSKEPQLRRLADLPRTAGSRFTIALADLTRSEATVARLREGGWTVTEATSLAGVDAYRDFIAASAGEIAITKDAYVEGRAGWIGDRSCQYLAAGRPVVIRATGLCTTVPLGEGLVEFATMQQAADAVALVEGDHHRHAQHARELAREYFDARIVLSELVETAMCRQPTPGGGG